MEILVNIVIAVVAFAAGFLACQLVSKPRRLEKLLGSITIIDWDCAQGTLEISAIPRADLLKIIVAFYDDVNAPVDPAHGTEYDPPAGNPFTLAISIPGGLSGQSKVVVWGIFAETSEDASQTFHEDECTTTTPAPTTPAPTTTTTTTTTAPAPTTTTTTTTAPAPTTTTTTTTTNVHVR